MDSMKIHAHVTSLVLFAVFADHALRAQAVGVSIPEDSVPASWNRGFGLQRADGDLWGIGPSYKARFTAAGVEFTPVMGPAAPKSFPLVFSLESVRRGDALIYEAPPGGIEPNQQGAVARYERGTFVEAYEVRGEGIEQTFRFESLPQGTGELIVRGRLTTELLAPAVDSASEGIRFEIGDLGGVSFGSVTGIDADGNRAAGWLRLEEGHLELGLPGEFVDEAPFPLLLDPLIGSTVTITGGYDLDPDVAYDATVDVYLVVWERMISSTNYDVLGQRFSSAGALLGAPIPISTIDARGPAVANLGAIDRFIVVWRHVSTTNPWSARTVNPIDGSTGLEIGCLVGTPCTGSASTGLDVSGYAGNDPIYASSAVVVFSDPSSSGIRYRVVNVSTNGFLSTNSPVVVST